MSSHLSEWLLSKRQQIISVGKNMEKREPSYIVGATTMEDGMEMLQRN